MTKDFYGTWYGCAPGSTIVDGELIQPQPPSREHVDAWLELASNDNKIKNDVRHRYILTKRNCRTFTNWAKRQWFFTNATPKQIAKCAELVGLTS